MEAKDVKMFWKKTSLGYPHWEAEIRMRQPLRNLIQEPSLDIYENQLPIEVLQRDDTQSLATNPGVKTQFEVKVDN